MVMTKTRQTAIQSVRTGKCKLWLEIKLWCVFSGDLPDLQLYPRFGLWPAATAREESAVFWELCGGQRRRGGGGERVEMGTMEI